MPLSTSILEPTVNQLALNLMRTHKQLLRRSTSLFFGKYSACSLHKQLHKRHADVWPTCSVQEPFAARSDKPIAKKLVSGFGRYLVTGSQSVLDARVPFMTLFNL